MTRKSVVIAGSSLTLDWTRALILDPTDFGVEADALLTPTFSSRSVQLRGLHFA
jgi:hypothetical protein